MAEKLYLYLVSRDKKGFKLVTTFPATQQCPPTKITDIAALRMAEETTKAVESIAYEHRMKYDLWIQSAADFKSLKKSLEYRGYSNLPIQMSPLHVQGTKVRKKSDPKPKKEVDVRHVQPKGVMLRRKSDQRRVT